MNPNDVCIVSAKRTPLGCFQGKLKSFSAVELCSKAISAALEACPKVQKEDIEEAFIGHVMSANCGQAPAKQAIIGAGLDCPATLINKVCASGMKAISLASQSIQLGLRDVIVCGGMESMTNVPYYSPDMRSGARMGNKTFIDGMITDGLWDSFNDKHMGVFAEKCARDNEISREEQDEFAVNSYDKAKNATLGGKFTNEIIPIEVVDRRGKVIDTVTQDEECMRENSMESMAMLRPCFERDGTVTAANASTLSDGACALVLTSRRYAKEHELEILAVVRGYDDATVAPEDFTVAPAGAMKRVLQRLDKSIEDVDLFEINEAFSVVPLANCKILEIPVEKVNIHGGGVAMGHPLGCSGARIVVTLLNALKAENKKFGLASVCAGGGDASSLAIEIPEM
eukprot:TRINITY_DN778199_c0_g1_i1.p1 TRINITY_DN778199_c0_g1~~TRINITY_DN778199_c0_g1_i1.p1  ORF type:complete len:420 (-),score=140.46 TRINITY_DN778199_c0_g1_i1:116-1309(-)